MRKASLILLVMLLSTAAAGTRDGWDQVPEILSRIVPPTFPNRDFNVTDYGAVGDGVTDCNPAFKKAIAACTKAGGGRVVVPKGTFLSNGPIHLDNNVNLHVTEDATIKFGTNFDDYLPHVISRCEGTVCYTYSPLIYAYQKTNVAVTGSGTLDGQAEDTWARWPDKTRPGTKPNEALREMGGRSGSDFGPVKDRVFYFKPNMIEPYECENVLIEDVKIVDYPFWCVHPTFCTNVTVRKLRLDSHNSNNDGINPDSSTDVLIEDCWLDQSDDAIAIKAGRDQDAWRVGKPCQNIIIRNMPSNFEGVAIGSEMSGGVRNVFIYDSDYDDGDILYCKSNLDRGGFIKDIYVKNLNVGKARILRLRNNYHGYRGGHFPTEFRNINIENVHIKDGDDETISVQGVEEAPVYDVFIKNVTVDNIERGPILHLRHAENIVLTNVRIAGELQPTHPKIPMVAEEEEQEESEPRISAIHSGNWSDTSIWDVWTAGGPDGTADGRLPTGTEDERVMVGANNIVPSGVKVTLDKDIDDEIELRVFENSTLIIPHGRTLKIYQLRPDRQDSKILQTGGTVEVSDHIRIDDPNCQYVISGGSISVGTDFRMDEGTFVIDDSSSAITLISVAGAFKTGEGDGDTTTNFIAHSGGVTPIQCKDVQLNSYLGETLIVDVTNYDYTTNGDLVLFSYTGTRTGKFDGDPEKPTPRVTVIGAKADLVYDDAGKKIKLTNFRP
ncbi:MAG: glycoside hydrolase family 28 protein [Candidatus Zixiibacteriota bacterium]